MLFLYVKILLKNILKPENLVVSTVYLYSIMKFPNRVLMLIAVSSICNLKCSCCNGRPIIVMISLPVSRALLLLLDYSHEKLGIIETHHFTVAWPKVRHRCFSNCDVFRRDRGLMAQKCALHLLDHGHSCKYLVKFVGT